MARTPQRFRPDDRVLEVKSFDRGRFKLRQGTITECVTKTNKIGARNYHYHVLWDGYSHTQLMIQHRLTPLEK